MKITGSQFLIPIIFASFFLVQCSRKSKADKSVEKTEAGTDHAAEGYVKGMVLDMNGKLDGCTWLIELEDKKKLEPMNLDETFRADSLSVWIRYTENKSAMSICMAGPIVKITAIEKR